MGVIVVTLLLLDASITFPESQRFDAGFDDGYGVSLFLTPDGELSTIHDDWDLNDDGWIDLVVIDEFQWEGSKQNQSTYSFVFWGSAGGFSKSRCDSFFTCGAECAAAADFNLDGRTDLVVANSCSPYSYVFYGSPGGINFLNPDSFKSVSNHGSITVAELNGDGWLDLVWSNWFGWGGYSKIYWGSGRGFDESRTDSLPTGPAHGNMVADFDADGYPDIFWAVYYEDRDYIRRPSLIYWGGPDGYSVSRKTELPTVGPGDDIAVGDLDRDGLLDIVIPNHSVAPPPQWTAYDYSYIYYGAGGRLFCKDSLYAHAPWGASVGDIDDDGWLDIVFACSGDINSLWYKGSRKGFVEYDILPVIGASSSCLVDFNMDGRCDIALGSQLTSQMKILYKTNTGWKTVALDAKGIDAGMTRDAGNPADHDNRASYTSPVLQITSSSDSIVVIDSFRIASDVKWFGSNEAKDAGVEIWVSYMCKSGEKTWSDWMLYEPGYSGFTAGRALRYKVCFKTAMLARVTVRSVELFYRVIEEPTGLIIRRIGSRNYEICFNQLSLLSQAKPPSIYDLAGRKVKTLRNMSGNVAYWNGDDNSGVTLASGIYFLVVNNGVKNSSYKLVLLPD